MRAIFYKTILRLNYLKSLNKIELPVQLPPEAPPTFGIVIVIIRAGYSKYANYSEQKDKV